MSGDYDNSFGHIVGMVDGELAVFHFWEHFQVGIMAERDEMTGLQLGILQAIFLVQHTSVGQNLALAKTAK